MFKSFLGLWLLVFTPLFFLLYPSSINPILKFNSHIEGERYIEIYAGTYDLIESALASYEDDALVEKFNAVRSQFGFDLVLTTVSELGLSDDTIKALADDNIVFVNDEPEYLLKRFGNNGDIIQLYTDFSADEEIYNSAKGTVALLKGKLMGLPSKDLSAAIVALENNFPYTLSLQSSTGIELTPIEKHLLEARGFFWREPSASQVSFYIPVDHGGQFLVANLIPTTSVNASVIFILIGVFILAISIGMFLWVYPLWRDLNRLLSASEQLGQGELESRAFVSSISVIAKLGQTFNSMADKLSQLLTGQRTLTNAIAHDLRTPLYRLKFALEMFEDASDESQKSRYKNAIDNSIKDLDHLVNQTLMLSKYTNEKELVTFVKYDVTSLVSEEVAATSPLHPNLTWDVSHDNPGAKVSVDRLAVKRALNNLLSNASKYAAGKIHIRTYVDSFQQNFVIEVSDDGPGVAQDDQENIFIPFVQSTVTNQPGKNGHGLGLAIVQQIAKWHDGEICVRDSHLGGAQFTLTIAMPS